ncbi:hypothetical protein [Microvirga sp. M2]|uniref:hypothetical protein n=1 Tax=Microvirga sp. M2 TaxID=3073270 RepID=UPI0039C02EFC
MSRRGRTHSGTCAIAVASLACGLHAASLPLGAQPLPSAADQPQADPGIEFQERFSPGIRAQPVFTRPDIQALIASLPPSASAGAPGPTSGPPAALAAVPETQAEPEIPPPPYPPDIAVSSISPPRETAKAAPRPAPAHVSRNVSRKTPKNPAAKHGARQGAVKRQARHVAATASIRTGAGAVSRAAPPAAACPNGLPCATEQQTFGIFFGFLAGALLGGPFGALVGGAMGAAATAEPSQGTSPGRAARP